MGVAMHHTRLIKITVKYVIAVCIWTSFHYDCTASSKKNKDSYELIEENFSKGDEINIKGLYKHLHYTFQNETLLRQALHPLLPPRLRSSELKYEHLEFVGDAVLGLIIREHILDLFPNQKRGLLNDLYSSLTQNKTLADVYKKNLTIEQYLPYPGKITCEYCNVVEALIGAIYNDDAKNGLNNSRKFVLRLLDIHILEKKWQEVLEGKKSLSKGNEPEIEMLLAEDIPISSRLREIIEYRAKEKSIDTDNPKSTLIKILTQFCDDRPEYSSPLLAIDEYDRPGFCVNIVGAQIGRSVKGFGYTLDGAEQDAARNALNILAQRELIAPEILSPQKQSYTKFINEYCSAKGLPLTSTKKDLVPESLLFNAKIQVEDEIMEATGPSKKKAEEKAAEKVRDYLIETKKVDQNLLDESKEAKSILREWFDQKKINYLKFHETTSSQRLYEFNIKIGDSITGEGIDSLKQQARENAYREIFEKLYEKQEQDIKDKQKITTLAKPAKSVRQSKVAKAKELEGEKEEPLNSPPVAEKKVYKESPRNQISLSSSLSSPLGKKKIEGKPKKKPKARTKKKLESSSPNQSPQKQNINNSTAATQQRKAHNIEKGKAQQPQSSTLKAKPTGGNLNLIEKKPNALEQEKIN